MMNLVDITLNVIDLLKRACELLLAEDLVFALEPLPLLICACIAFYFQGL